jgi:hypothetical protein
VGSNPEEEHEFLRTIKISSTPSLGWDVKPEVTCRKILRNVKSQSLASVKEIIRRLNSYSFRPFILLVPR